MGPWEFTLKEQELVALTKLKGSHRIFLGDMTDIFHPKVPWAMLDRVFEVMASTPQHTFQLLTKRPGRMAHYADNCGMPWPDNVWAMTSVESAKYLPRLDLLAHVPAKVRGVSLEPLLGPVDVRPWLLPQNSSANFFGSLIGERPVLNLVIVGGESGPGARPMHPAWARSIRDQCQAAGVSFFFKQWGEWLGVVGRPLRNTKPLMWKAIDLDGSFVEHLTPGVEIIERVGKKAAGSLLDGREWREMP